ncbi:hypothetical protein FE391_35610 [Nonomuraea sp. KC401]|uniref:hypothetical protein n=1 Tax=unclassified Nonomuraea TaxID=2593643 RepID=UPI0010FF600B|nr:MULTISPECIES: hypothetical protein [unclassified Nonomuraea]NBE99300.1 hypothetical protein [Nonomuraea sp. K271]TLF58989.1 hypothetical protein FE391_35610 [Nonomuraea sp. KC401]
MTPLHRADQQRIAGAFLVLSFVTFTVGATLPLVGAKGNSKIFTLPVREHLQAVAGNPGSWRWANLFMSTAVVLLVLGMTILVTMLERVDERMLSRIALTTLLLAALLWLVYSAFRSTVTMSAARETVSTGAVPPYYDPWSQWAAGLFQIYTVLGCVGLAALGGSLLMIRLIPTWAGWTTIAISVATLLHLLSTGNTLPAFHYLPCLLIGVLLLIRRPLPLGPLPAQ